MCAKWQWNALDWCYWIALPASPVVQSSNTVACVSLSFRTHPCVLAIKTTSMETVSTGVLDKKEHYLRNKDKAEKACDVSRHIRLHMSKCQQNEDLHSIMSQLQSNCCLKVDFQKVDQHTGSKWSIHDTKRRKDNQLKSLKLPCKIAKLHS